jgi:hypothetical protein
LGKDSRAEAAQSAERPAATLIVLVAFVFIFGNNLFIPYSLIYLDLP